MPATEEMWRAVWSGLDFAEDPPSLILGMAAEKLAASYWIKGETATTYRGDEARRYDLIGVVISTTGFEIHEQTYRNKDGSIRGICPSEKLKYRFAPKRSNYELWSRTITRRGRKGYLRCLYYLTVVTGEADLEFWNDEVAHDKDEVVDALRKAAFIAKECGE